MSVRPSVHRFVGLSVMIEPTRAETRIKGTKVVFVFVEEGMERHGTGLFAPTHPSAKILLPRVSGFLFSNIVTLFLKASKKIEITARDTVLVHTVEGVFFASARPAHPSATEL